jgi:hypothetical protein
LLWRDCEKRNHPIRLAYIPEADPSLQTCVCVR